MEKGLNRTQLKLIAIAAMVCIGKMQKSFGIGSRRCFYK